MFYPTPVKKPVYKGRVLPDVCDNAPKYGRHIWQYADIAYNLIRFSGPCGHFLANTMGPIYIILWEPQKTRLTFAFRSYYVYIFDSLSRQSRKIIVKDMSPIRLLGCVGHGLPPILLLLCDVTCNNCNLDHVSIFIQDRICNSVKPSTITLILKPHHHFRFEYL